MQSRYRSAEDRDADIAYIAGALCEGLNNTQIAERLDAERDYVVTMDMVRDDRLLLEQRWRDENLEAWDSARRRVLRELQHVKRTAWSEYRASQAPAVETRVETTAPAVAANAAATGTGPPTGARRTAVTRKERNGSDKYLRLVIDCIGQEIKLRGLDSETSVNDMLRRESEALAREFGLEPDQILREAEGILRGDPRQQES